MAGSCQCGNKPSGSLKSGQFLDQLSNCQLLERPCTMEQASWIVNLHTHTQVHWQVMMKDLLIRIVMYQICG